MRAAFVTLRRLHALAAHGHPTAEYREAYTGAERFHQQIALDRAMAVTSPTDEFDNRLTIILHSTGVVGPCEKIPNSGIGLNPFMESVRLAPALNLSAPAAH